MSPIEYALLPHSGDISNIGQVVTHLGGRNVVVIYGERVKADGQG